MVMCAPAAAQAQNVTLAWDASPDTDVVGYTLHVGVNPGSYGQTFDISGRTNTTFTFSQPVPGQRYYFAVSAYDAENESSALSNMISWKINVGPSLTQPLAQTTAIGSTVSLQLNATDDGDTLTYSAVGLPPGVSLNTSSGVLSGTPTTAGIFTVVATVSDGLLTSVRTFIWTITARLNVTSLTSSVASPQVAGTSIVLTASATGGVTPHQFRFLQTVGGNTTVIRDWAASATHTWSPTQAGTYVITVWGRSAGATANTAEDTATLNFTISTGPLSLTGLSASLPSPQNTGTAITFSAAATGGTSPYQYKYLMTAAGSNVTVTLRDWNASAIYTWAPSQPNTYTITVWARSAGQTADAAEASRTLSYTVTAPFALTGITSSLQMPQITGTTITFTALTAGGQTPHQYKWWLSANGGSTWTLLRDWAANASFAWTPTQPNPYYRVAVWARPAGVTADISTYSTSVPAIINAPPALRVTSLSSNLASPQRAGTPVTFTAAATGGVGPYQYKWYLYNGSAWSVLSDWSSSTSSYTWTPAAAGANYQVSVGVRNATTTSANPDAAMSLGYVVTSGSSPLTITNLSSSVASPQAPGRTITFSAIVSGGTGPHQYQWWLFTGSGWTVVQNWSTASSWTWTPTVASSDYQVRVWARNATTTGDVADAQQSMSYVIRATSTPLRLTSLTSDLASPRPAGTTITFTAMATGGTAPHQYKWWLYNGLSWTVVQDWNTSATFAWTPVSPGSNYQVSVGVRNANSSSTQPEAALSVDYAVSRGTAALAIASLTSSVPAPQVVGTPVTFAATVAGGTTPVQYKWWLSTGSGWIVVQNWSTVPTWAWTPTAAGANYQVRVWARNATTTADVADAERSIAYAVTAGASTPLRVTGVTSDVPSPQPVGRTVTFTAAVAGGVGPHQYQWWVFNGIRWAMVQDWNASSSFSWMPATVGANYQVSVGVRNATTTSNRADAAYTAFYAIESASGPLRVTSLTTDLPSPQDAGTTVTFTAEAIGGTGSYQYQWWEYNGSRWRMVQNWSASPNYTWTPSAAGSDYQVSVAVRNATTTTNTAEAARTAFFVVAPSSGSGQ